MPLDDRPGLQIETSVDVDGFFQQVVSDAIRHCGVETSQASAQYLAGVLVTFSKPGQESAFEKPFSFLLVEALEKAGAERFERLRLVGDAVLYLSGFFGEHLDRQGIERGYVNGLGATAYDHAASMLRRGGTGAVPDLFDELASNFDSFVNLLGTVADSFSAQQTQDARGLLDIYERWLKSRSPVLQVTLRQHGLIPLRGDRTLH